VSRSKRFGLKLGTADDAAALAALHTAVAEDNLRLRRRWQGQARLPAPAGAIHGRMSPTAIRPTSTPSITSGTDWPALKTRGLP
jgi:hypothetical protein